LPTDGKGAAQISFSGAIPPGEAENYTDLPGLVIEAEEAAKRLAVTTDELVGNNQLSGRGRKDRIECMQTLVDERPVKVLDEIECQLVRRSARSPLGDLSRCTGESSDVIDSDEIELRFCLVLEEINIHLILLLLKPHLLEFGPVLKGQIGSVLHTERGLAKHRLVHRI